MIKFTLLLALSALFSTFAYSQVNSNYHYVEGYTKSNGTYVEGHYKTNPNSTINDNYSTYPNVNPHTGEVGTVEPDYSIPTYSTPGIDYSTPDIDYSTPDVDYSTPDVDYSTPDVDYSTPNIDYSTPSYNYSY